MSSNAKTLFMDYRSKPEDLPRVDLPMLGDGAHVFLRPLSGRGRDRWSLELATRSGLATAVLIQDTVCDETGKRLFLESEVEQIANKPAELLSVLDSAIHREERLFSSDEDTEEEAKN